MTALSWLLVSTLPLAVQQDDEARRLLQRAAAACASAKTAAYEAVHAADYYDRDGELRTSTSRARVAFSRNADDPLFPGRVRIAYVDPDDGREVVYRDGVETLLLPGRRRAAVNRRGAAGLVNGRIYWAEMVLGDLAPRFNATSRPTLERILLTASVLRLAEPEDVGGRRCHVVAYEQPRDWRELAYEGRVYLDTETTLPRKHVHLAVPDEGAKGGSTLVIDELVLDADLHAETFELPIPEGYETSESDRDPPSRTEFLAVGAVAPDWELTAADGTVHRLKDYRGKVVVLDFWGTWCGPCLAAMPHVQALHERFADRPVAVLGVSCREKPDADPAGLMRERGFTYELLLDGDRVADVYGVPAYPTLLVIAPDGELVHREVGLDPDDVEAIAEVIDAALERHPP